MDVRQVRKLKIRRRHRGSTNNILIELFIIENSPFNEVYVKEPSHRQPYEKEKDDIEPDLFLDDLYFTAIKTF